MLKKLTTIGNSLGIIIERPILELLAIDKDTPLDVTTDGDVLILRPVREDHRQRVQAAAHRLMEVHDATLKRLAD
jgi:antitoxin component of MazEF toxin-antitoxin module